MKHNTYLSEFVQDGFVRIQNAISNDVVSRVGEAVIDQISTSSRCSVPVNNGDSITERFSKIVRQLRKDGQSFFEIQQNIYETLKSKQLIEEILMSEKIHSITTSMLGSDLQYQDPSEFVINEIAMFYDKKILSNCKDKISKNGSTMPFSLKHQKEWNPFLNCSEDKFKKAIADFPKNEGKISAKASEIDFFNFIREKRNKF